MEKQILLSISILVSGRDNTARQCIDSLDRLRGRVACELLVVDTGCSERMRSWLEQRADKVIPFQWCNDFSAARNAGLKEASGKWFMFLDDDEWFESTDGIERFFLGGEYKQYASASYVIRNYLDMEGRQWQDISLPRMARRDTHLCFVYPVHEMLWPRYEPEKQLEDYVHHYGYASADPRTQNAKHKRNLELLMPAIEKDPGCMHHYLQAVMEYIALEDLEAALGIGETGIRRYEPGRKDNGNFLCGLYAGVVKIRVMLSKYQEACESGREILQRAELSRLAQASIWGDLAIAWSAKTGQNAERTWLAAGRGAVRADYMEAAEMLRKYLKEREYFSTHLQQLREQQTLILDICFDRYHYQMIMAWGFAAALYAGEADAAEMLLGSENTSWWLEAAQNWYTFTSEHYREKWREAFQALADSAKRRYPKLNEFYETLTNPNESVRAKEEEEGADERKKSVPEPGMETNSAVGAEMEALALRLKEQIRLLICQNQEEAALAAVKQLLIYFPSDGELLGLREALEDK